MLESKGSPSAHRLSKIAASAGEMGEMRRFAGPGIRIVGPLSGIREPRPPGERGAQHPGRRPHFRTRVRAITIAPRGDMASGLRGS